MLKKIAEGVDKKKLVLFLAVTPPFMGLTSGTVNAVILLLSFGILMSIERVRMDTFFFIWAGLFISLSLLSSLWAYSTQTILSTTLSYVQVCILYYVIVTGCDDSAAYIFYVIQCMFLGSVIFSAKVLLSASLSDMFRRDGRLAVGNAVPFRLTFLSVLLYMNRSRFQHKWLPFAGIVLFVFISFLQGSRKGIIILVMGFALTFFFEAREKQNLFYYFRTLVLLAILAALFYWLCMKTELYYSIGIRIEKTLFFLNTGQYADGSTRARYKMVLDALRIWKENPLLGAGQDNFRYINQAENGKYSHCNYTELLANLGMIGLALYYSYYLVKFKTAVRVIFSTKDSRAAQPFIIAGIMLLSDFFFVSYSGEFVFILWGYLVAYSRCYSMKSVKQQIIEEKND